MGFFIWELGIVYETAREQDSGHYKVLITPISPHHPSPITHYPSPISMKIRLFNKQDAEQIARLFHQTVREVNISNYSVNQVKAWAPDDIYFRDWINVCSQKFTYVADNNGIIAGFGELEPNGHIDCFYCHKDYQRMGVGSKIYQAIEAKAYELEIHRLYVEASITAKPFFQRMGFSVIKEQQVECRGENFINYVMEKYLTASSGKNC
ncbi:GNAT family N-acetyltransferase [Rivularia sp. UHCC 0363]|uniref:GNAT family N-acetyltransferase n=1 Tax=Rivularia sp. UHCC 0363 TaxID=3110244 RepID=UPI003A599908